ncbi:hypothetical protein EYF80_053255 [Liparis tanakae]|uniref:Uncharacterized protein n=1 Tax=Liparis tanakae TaxID=230148 RepID=A0A4Z2F661_9TELE|nr:hypothetical protein EYF80_053255 [Liparis tanakae]
MFTALWLRFSVAAARIRPARFTGRLLRVEVLPEIETSHRELLKSLGEPLVLQEPEDQQCCSATVSRTPSLDRGSGDGKEGSPAEPKVQSTGF